MNMPASVNHTLNASQGATDHLAAFAIASHSFPPLARTRALDAVKDCIGCILAGSSEPLSKPFRKVIGSIEQPTPELSAFMVGLGRYAAPSDAALFNATLAHALDYDDTNHPAYAHPSAVLVPTLLALSPMVNARGCDLIDAYIVGFEVFGKLGRALNTQHYKRGWHATGTFGTLAAVVAAGRLLKLSHAQMVMAIGIAASAASGLRVNFGSMVKPLHAGYAARNGVLAALLAQSGFDSSQQALEHRYGYLSVFNDGIGFDINPMLMLGQDLEILTEHGLALKPYPACGATHPGIEAAILLSEEIKPNQIERVHAGVCEMALSPLIYVKPESALEGKFSLHYCIAVALLDGRVDLESFSAQRIADPVVQDLIERIDMRVDPRWQHDSEFATEVSVYLKDGRTLSRFVPLAQGKPARWFSDETLRLKFEDCARHIDQTSREAVWKVLSRLDGMNLVTDLLSVLSKCGLEREFSISHKKA